MIVTATDETKQTLEKTLNLALKLKPDTAQFFPIMVYPGTAAYEEAKQHLDLQDPGERDVLMTLLKSMRDSEKNVQIIASELEIHFGISA